MPVDETENIAAPVTPALLRRIAGDTYFQRGKNYFAAGAVESIRRDSRGVKATVIGTEFYRVRLWVTADELHHSCTCPLGDDGQFCKHCVATGLAWHAGRASGEADAAEITDAANIEAELGGYLRGLDKEQLVALLLDLAEDNGQLHRQLSIGAAVAKPGGPDLSVWKGAMDDALQSRGYDGIGYYRDESGRGADFASLTASLRDMLKAGKADSVINLAEYGLAEIEEAVEYDHDPEEMLSYWLDELQELHLEACQTASPDPEALAERLFEQQMESDFGVFDHAVSLYADVLGEAGQKAYARLALDEWEKYPVLGPGDSDTGAYGRRGQIAAIMESLAEASGDVQDRVAILSRNLSSAYSFSRIAELYRNAGDPEQALAWAERGWLAFPGSRDRTGLREFIATAYQDQGRHDEAMPMIWEPFARAPSLQSYRTLQEYARRAGQQEDWHAQAIDLVRTRITGGQELAGDRAGWTAGHPEDHSLLVQIFLHEDNIEAAWSEAREGGCSQRLWLELAARRAETDPDGSLAIYKEHLDDVLRNTGGSAYQQAVGIIGKMLPIFEQDGQDEAFWTLLTDLRDIHRRRRKFIGMLDEQGW